MARAKLNHVKANKDYPDQGIKKGEMYYWWAFRYGGKHRSKDMPSGSRLEGNDFQRALLEAQEQLEGPWTSVDDLKSAVDGVTSDMETLRDEQQDKFDNMPEGLQQGETGQKLENRVSELDSLISELEGIDFDLPNDETGDESVKEEVEKARAEELHAEIEGFNWCIE